MGNSKQNSMRITSDNIQSLKDNEVFVFGSNLSGIHGGGAAKLAFERFGAIYGNGQGMQGKSYAIPTKSEGIKRSLTVEEIRLYVNKFISDAIVNPDLTFLVTEIGCGLAGHHSKDIAPLFSNALNIENIYLPQSFLDVLNTK